MGLNQGSNLVADGTQASMLDFDQVSTIIDSIDAITIDGHLHLLGSRRKDAFEIAMQARFHALIIGSFQPTSLDLVSIRSS